MKTEEKKNPETRGEIAREGIEIDLEKNGEKVTGGYATLACESDDDITLPLPLRLVPHSDDDDGRYVRTSGYIEIETEAF